MVPASMLHFSVISVILEPKPKADTGEADGRKQGGDGDASGNREKDHHPVYSADPAEIHGSGHTITQQQIADKLRS